MTVGVVEVGVAERYRCAYLHCTQGLAGRGDGYAWGRSRLEKFKEHMISVTAMDMAFIAN